MAKPNLFNECPGSPTETFGPEGMRAHRRIVCRYEDRVPVVARLLARDARMALPSWYPTTPGAVAMRIKVEPFDPDTPGLESASTENLPTSPSGQYVQILAEYEFVQSADDVGISHSEGLIITYRQDYGGEIVQAPSYSLKWQSDGLSPVVPDSAPTLRVPITEHHVTVYGATTLPMSGIRGALGCVNSTTFLGAAAGTVLFDGAKIDRVFVKFSDVNAPLFGWKMRLLFREKTVKLLNANVGQVTIGWNHSYRPEIVAGAHWDKLVNETNETLYRSVDLNYLFNF